jgi:hypothetical protein
MAPGARYQPLLGLLLQYRLEPGNLAEAGSLGLTLGRRVLEPRLLDLVPRPRDREVIRCRPSGRGNLDTSRSSAQHTSVYGPLDRRHGFEYLPVSVLTRHLEAIETLDRRQGLQP